MNLSRVLLVIALVLSVASVGCASGGGIRHGWIMRGQVLALNGDVATVCVGSCDGAKIGQVLVVHHITVKPGISSRGSATIVRTDVGQVRITELFEDHYARALVESGNPAVNDVVELEMK